LYRADPSGFRARYADAIAELAQTVVRARQALSAIQPSAAAELLAVEVVGALQIPSHRAEIVLLEAARGHAALHGRSSAEPDDVALVAPLVLRQRRSAAIDAEAERVLAEDAAIRSALAEAGSLA
jgi:magnesium chelatase subunit I